MRTWTILLRREVISILLIVPSFLWAQEEHNHPAPEKLGQVSFPISCAPAVQQQFERGVALLHSFAYNAAESAFRAAAESDPNCAIAHWGIAMSYFHQLWDPPLSPKVLVPGQREIQGAQSLGTRSQRERKLIDALALVYQDANVVPYRTRALNYERAMGEVAAANGTDTESQVFYALALLATALPTDRTHGNQKNALGMLEPLYRKYPQHPGIAHYVIHACDNGELADRGLVAARAYSKIAPSAPHALHMPSHIFTRLGLWEDSVDSNRAAKKAAQEQGDVGEQLHAMDYLVYAYLQMDRNQHAAEVIQHLWDMRNLGRYDFKASYAATAMPVRYAVERDQWADAARIAAPAQAPAHVIAIAVWARALGLARNRQGGAAHAEIERLGQLEQQLRLSGNGYWATQVDIQKREAMAWLTQSEGEQQRAVALMRQAADDEDAIEKLPVTPGPILPAREQLGDLLLEQNQPRAALKEFETALAGAPQRRRSLVGAARAAELSGNASKAKLFRNQQPRSEASHTP